MRGLVRGGGVPKDMKDPERQMQLGLDELVKSWEGLTAKYEGSEK